MVSICCRWMMRLSMLERQRELKGLRDRLLSKHVSGDDSHSIQRAFKLEFLTVGSGEII